MVSDMHPDVPWREVATKLIVASKKTGAFFSVIDVAQLERIVVYTAQSVAGLENNLFVRLNAVIDSGTALVRLRLAPGMFPYE